MLALIDVCLPLLRQQAVGDRRYEWGCGNLLLLTRYTHVMIAHSYALKRE
jgi:hypothetical protein